MDLIAVNSDRGRNMAESHSISENHYLTNIRIGWVCLALRLGPGERIVCRSPCSQSETGIASAISPIGG